MKTKAWGWLRLAFLGAFLVAAACRPAVPPAPTPTTPGPPLGDAGPPPRVGAPLTGPGYAGPYGLGRDATPGEIEAWDTDVMPDGAGLPPGRGTPAEGASVFAAKCASCHGDRGQGGLPATSEVLVGVEPWFQPGNPRAVGPRTIGNYWPYATTLFDYVHRAMPFDRPGSLADDEVYAVVAWLLNQNEIIGDDAVMDAETLPKVQMPARDVFVPDPRPWPEYR